MTEGCIAGTADTCHLTPGVEVSSLDPDCLLLTKVEQEPPIAESMRQEVVKPPAAPGSPAHDISSPER